MEQFDNYFDPNQDSKQNETLPLDVIILRAIDGQLYDTHVAMPAIIVGLKGNQYADIQPAFKRRYQTGELVDLPVVQEVPVQMPGGKDYWIKLPIAVGDVGLLICAERSLDAWIAGNGGPVDPQDPRKHDLSDAIFIPGINPKGMQLPGNASDLIMHNSQAEIIMKKTGKFQIKNDSEELLLILDDLVDNLINALVFTDIGPQPFIDTTILALEAIKARLETLKV